MVLADWALKSVSAEKWLSEGPFEATKFYSGAKKSRIAHGRFISPSLSRLTSI
jgi:hypothetical protein